MSQAFRVVRACRDQLIDDRTCHCGQDVDTLWFGLTREFESEFTGLLLVLVCWVSVCHSGPRLRMLRSLWTCEPNGYSWDILASPLPQEGVASTELPPHSNQS
ncbi:hypothetical protein J6590_035604 [Homalodisca vitripennis]|nr:hypothetical protein J6590_035604 [Homalodisca vitripennis]